MTEFEIPAWAQNRLIDRSVRKLVHDDVYARETALVVVDMQTYFLDAASPAYVPAAVAIVPAINRVARALRDAGGHVVWIRTMYTKEAESSISHFHHVLLKPAAYQYRCKALTEGSEASEVWPELDVAPQDLVIRKTRYSAFTADASDLDAQLREREVKAVWIAGTMTNVCCDSTARDAMMHNYRTTMLHDCNASLTEAEHTAALLNFHMYFGDVCGSDEAISRFA